MDVARKAVHERVLRLGSEGHLVAIATDPPAPLAAPGVIFLNAGVLHRVGPHRLHVLLARRLAAAGFAAVRMDLSGIGDSSPVPSGMSFRASSVADVRAAMDGLGSDDGTGARFVLFGLCSGADNALATRGRRSCHTISVASPASLPASARITSPRGRSTLPKATPASRLSGVRSRKRISRKGRDMAWL